MNTPSEMESLLSSFSLIYSWENVHVDISTFQIGSDSISTGTDQLVERSPYAFYIVYYIHAIPSFPCPFSKEKIRKIERDRRKER
jgi:hypothetical protein